MKTYEPPLSSFQMRMNRYFEVTNAEKEAERIVNQRYDNVGISTKNAIAPPRQYKQSNRAPSRLREAILDRDDYTCTECGSEEGELHVHHIKARADGGKNMAGNLTTLCEKCHAKKHEGQPIHRLMTSRMT